MNKIPWKLIWAFCIPLNFAFGSFYVSSRILGEEADCRNYDVFIKECADAYTLFLFDIFIYLGIALVIISFVLPMIVSYRQKRIIETKIFK